MSNQISSFKILFMGQLMVNLPVIAVILLSAFVLLQLGMNWNLALILGSIAGWFTWSKLLDKWKDWATEQQVDRERLFRLGQIGLINFFRYRILDDQQKN